MSPLSGWHLDLSSQATIRRRRLPADHVLLLVLGSTDECVVAPDTGDAYGALELAIKGHWHLHHSHTLQLQDFSHCHRIGLLERFGRPWYPPARERQIGLFHPSTPERFVKGHQVGKAR